jgi:hypothetical protein
MHKYKKYIFFAALFILIYSFSVIDNCADRDLWHRLAVGALFFNTGWVLKHDIFAYTPTKPLWVDHEWGSGVIFYFLSHHFGDSGLLILRILIIFAIILLIYAAIRLQIQRKVYPIGYLFLSFYALLPGVAITIRCQLFTYLFFTLWLYLLERVKRGENRLIWIFPVITLLWVNLHGGFVAGFGLIFIYALGELLNRKNPVKYLGILAACVPVTLINPYGFKFWQYMAEALTMPRPYITEWEPINIFYPPTDWLGFKVLLLISIIGIGYSLIFKIKKIDWTTLLLILTTLALTLRQERQAIFFIIAASVFSYDYFYSAISPIIAKISAKLTPRLSEKTLELADFTRQSIVYALIIVVCGYFSITSSHIINVKPEYYPVQAVEFIRINNVKGNLLVPFNWGSYALWKLYPQCLVPIDGRYEEVYTNDVYMDITRFAFSLNGWGGVLKKYHNDIILINKDSKTFYALKKLNNWKMIYNDKYSAVFVPYSTKKTNWLLPNKDIDYSKTKYISGINSLYLH